MTKQVRAVLTSFMEAVDHERFGYQILQATDLTSGSVYPILHRLEAAGWLTSVEETSPEKGSAVSRRYRLTASGLVEARKIMGANPLSLDHVGQRWRRGSIRIPEIPELGLRPAR